MTTTATAARARGLTGAWAWMDRHTPVLAGLVAFVVYVATRATIPTEWDGAQLVLALDRFDVRDDSPHPPGNWAYIGLGRAVRALTPLDGTASLTVAAAAAAAATVGLVVVLGRDLHGRWLGNAAAAIVATTPFFWFYGATVATYAFDALFAVVLLLLAWRARPGSWHGVGAAAALGLAGGFRQTALLLLFPITLVAVIRACKTLRAWLAAAGAGVLGIGCWLVPEVVEQPGGLSTLRGESSAWWTETGERTSVFYKGLSEPVREHLALFSAHVIAALGLVTLLGVVAWIVGRRSATRAPTSGWRLTPAWLLVVVIAPAIVFYVLFHFGKAGYVLAFLPAAVLLALLPVAGLPGKARWVGTVAVVCIALLGAERFLFGDGVLPAQFVDRGPWFTHRANGAPFTGTRDWIRIIDGQAAVFDDIREQFDPRRDVLVYDNENGGHLFRNAMLALPEFTIHWLNGADSLTGRGGRYQRENDTVIEVPEGGRAVFLLATLTEELTPLEQSGTVERIQLPSGPSAWIVPPGITLDDMTVAEVPGILDQPITVAPRPRV